MSLTRLCHQIIREHCNQHLSTLAIDATCGNGHDTVFLASLVELVLSFDIQSEAINNTRKRLLDHQLQQRVKLFNTSHEHIQQTLVDKQINQPIDIAMFNLGYLPKGKDPNIVTRSNSTLLAVKQVLDKLSPTGIISLLCYRGHTGGLEEFNAISQLITKISPKKWHIKKYESNNPSFDTPVLIIIQPNMN